ncbi:MAG: DUF1700 domain-containing protein [Sporolactobacillus sp.]
MENEFLRRLERLLRDIPWKDRQDILDDYRQHFNFGRSEGKSDQAIIDELGDLHTIAESIRGDYFSEAARSGQKVSIGRCLLAGSAMLLFNLIVMIGPIFSILGTYVCLAAVAIGLMAAPFIALFTLYAGGSLFLFRLSTGLVCLGLGMALAAGVWIVGKWLWHLFVLYVRFNIRIITGRGVR